MGYIFTYYTPKGAPLQDLSIDSKHLTIGRIVFKLWAKHWFLTNFHGFSWVIAQDFKWKSEYLTFLSNSVFKGSLGCWFQIRYQISDPIRSTASKCPLIPKNQVFPLSSPRMRPFLTFSHKNFTITFTI